MWKTGLTGRIVGHAQALYGRFLTTGLDYAKSALWPAGSFEAAQVLEFGMWRSRRLRIMDIRVKKPAVKR